MGKGTKPISASGDIQKALFPKQLTASEKKGER